MLTSLLKFIANHACIHAIEHRCRHDIRNTNAKGSNERLYHLIQCISISGDKAQMKTIQARAKANIEAYIYANTDNLQWSKLYTK